MGIFGNSLRRKLGENTSKLTNNAIFGGKHFNEIHIFHVGDP